MIPITVSNNPIAYDTGFTVGSIRYLVRMRWNLRFGDWRCSFENEATGEVIVSNRRLSPGALLVKLPEGEVHCFGDDPYEMGDLGQSLQLIFYTREELLAMAAKATIDGDPVARLAEP